MNKAIILSKKSFQVVTVSSLLSFLAIPSVLFASIVTPTTSTITSNKLTIGNTGKDVVVLQTFLEQNGYLIMPEGVSKGKYGNVTKDAVKKFQKDYGITQTGVFGPKTKASISSLSKKMTSAILPQETNPKNRATPAASSVSNNASKVFSVKIPVDQGTSLDGTMSYVNGKCEETKAGTTCVNITEGWCTSLSGEYDYCGSACAIDHNGGLCPSVCSKNCSIKSGVKVTNIVAATGGENYPSSGTISGTVSSGGVNNGSGVISRVNVCDDKQMGDACVISSSGTNHTGICVEINEDLVCK